MSEGSASALAPAARPPAVCEVGTIHAVPAAASAGSASCRGLSGLAGLLESVVMASSTECHPKAIIRWFNGVCHVVTRAVEGPGVLVSSLTQMLQHLLICQGLGVPFNRPFLPSPATLACLCIPPPHIIFM